MLKNSFDITIWYFKSYFWTEYRRTVSNNQGQNFFSTFKASQNVLTYASYQDLHIFLDFQGQDVKNSPRKDNAPTLNTLTFSLNISRTLFHLKHFLTYWQAALGYSEH